MGRKDGPKLPAEVLLIIAEYSLQILSDWQIWFELGQVSSLFRDAVERHILSSSSRHYPQPALIPDMDKRKTNRCYVECTGLDIGRIQLLFDGFDPSDRYLALFREDMSRTMDELESIQDRFATRKGAPPNSASSTNHLDRSVKHQGPTTPLKLLLPRYTTHVPPGSEKQRRYRGRDSRPIHCQTCPPRLTDIGPPAKVEVVSEKPIQQDFHANEGMGRLVVACDWRMVWTLNSVPKRMVWVPAARQWVDEWKVVRKEEARRKWWWGWWGWKFGGSNGSKGKGQSTVAKP